MLIQCIALAQFKLVEYCEVSFQFSMWTEKKMLTSQCAWGSLNKAYSVLYWMHGPEYAILQGYNCYYSVHLVEKLCTSKLY